jgi:two-component system LytT family sensor kinase
MDKTEKRICLYSAILIGLSLSSPKLLALRENGLMARYWHFNFPELLFQMIYSIAFCYFIFYINLRKGKAAAIYGGFGKQILNIFFNIFLMLFCCLAGGIMQRRLFLNFQLKGVFWSGYSTHHY